MGRLGRLGWLGCSFLPLFSYIISEKANIPLLFDERRADEEMSRGVHSACSFHALFLINHQCFRVIIKNKNRIGQTTDFKCRSEMKIS